MASFRKRGKTWEYRIRFTNKQTGLPDEESKLGFATKKEAQIAAAKVEHQLEYFGFSEDGNEILENYLKEWSETYKKHMMKPISYSVHERLIRTVILPRFGNYKLKDINRTEYQKWINSLSDNYAEGTIRRVHSVMNSAFSSAINDFNILYRNPLEKIRIPKQEKLSKVAYFTKEQLQTFLDHLKTPHKNSKYQHSIQPYTLFLLLARTGLRIGEALALNWIDLDEMNKTITINKTLVYPLNSTPYLSTPKSKSSERIIKLDDATFQALKKHRINQMEVILKYENYKKSENGFMFHQEDGRWLRTNVVRDLFKAKCKQCGVPILSPHALRHTHAVHLLEAGANIKYVSDRLGHSSIKMTADTYLHVTKKVEEDALQLYAEYAPS